MTYNKQMINGQEVVTRLDKAVKFPVAKYFTLTILFLLMAGGLFLAGRMSHGEVFTRSQVEDLIIEASYKAYNEGLLDADLVTEFDAGYEVGYKLGHRDAIDGLKECDLLKPGHFDSWTVSESYGCQMSEFDF